MSDTKFTNNPPLVKNERGSRGEVSDKISDRDSDEFIQETIDKVSRLQNDAGKAVKKLASAVPNSIFLKTLKSGRQ